MGTYNTYQKCLLVTKVQCCIRGETYVGFQAGPLSWSNRNQLEMLVSTEGGKAEHLKENSGARKNQQQTPSIHIALDQDQARDQLVGGERVHHRHHQDSTFRALLP